MRRCDAFIFGLTVVLVALAGCSGPSPSPDAGVVDAGNDAQRQDSGRPDTGFGDGSVVDGTATSDGSMDGAAASDATALDASAADGSAADGSAADATSRDASQDALTLDAGADATTAHDATTPRDSGTDGSVLPDAALTLDGAFSDAGEIADGSVADGFLDGASDAAPPFPALAPCADPSFYRDVTTNGPLPTLPPYVYANPCIRVSAGSTVLLNASALHPLTQSTRGTTMSPIPTNQPVSTSVTFNTPGFYPFYCRSHGTDEGAGMAGVVQVVPVR